MPSLLVHVTCGPENPTRAALAFLVARTAVEEGHSVSLFLAGDGAQLMRRAVIDGLNGLGTGSLREHYDELAESGARFYLSGMSSKARAQCRHRRDPRGAGDARRPGAAGLRARARTDLLTTYEVSMEGA